MIAVGDTFPKNIHITQVKDKGSATFSTDFFEQGRYILFAVPGAFTPTCSNDHLPGYQKRAEALKNKGIDGIFCLSVNDPFVMEAWKKAHQVGDEITFLADGSGQLTKALGTVLDLMDKGLGLRSQRYAMVMDKGIVTHLCMEKNAGQCSISHVDSLEDVL